MLSQVCKGTTGPYTQSTGLKPQEEGSWERECVPHTSQRGERNWLIAQERMLNITHTRIAIPSDNLCNVFGGKLGCIIYLLKPNKNILALCSSFGNLCCRNTKIFKEVDSSSSFKDTGNKHLNRTWECTVYLLC